MPKTRPPYPPQLRARLIEFARQVGPQSGSVGGSSHPRRPFATGSGKPIAMTVAARMA